MCLGPKCRSLKWRCGLECTFAEISDIESLGELRGGKSDICSQNGACHDIYVSWLQARFITILVMLGDLYGESGIKYICLIRLSKTAVRIAALTLSNCAESTNAVCRNRQDLRRVCASLRGYDNAANRYGLIGHSTCTLYVYTSVDTRTS